MSNFDKVYLDLCDKILTNGTYVQNRTGVATYKLPHQILQFDLSEIPIIFVGSPFKP